MANYREDIVNIDLECGNIFRSWMKHTIGEGDALADRFGVRVFRNGVPVQLSGTCTGYFIRADEGTIPVVNGVIDGNLAYVTLIDTCYAMEGVFSLAIKINDGAGEIVTLRIVDGIVSRTSSNIAVDPGTIIPSIADLIADINEAVASIPPDYSELVNAVYGVTRNLWENPAYNDSGVVVSENSDGSLHVSGTPSEALFIGKTIDVALPLNAYVFSCVKKGSANGNISAVLRNADNTGAKFITLTSAEKNGSMVIGYSPKRFEIVLYSGVTYDCDLYVQVELGSTRSEWIRHGTAVDVVARNYFDYLYTLTDLIKTANNYKIVQKLDDSITITKWGAGSGTMIHDDNTVNYSVLNAGGGFMLSPFLSTDFILQNTRVEFDLSVASGTVRLWLYGKTKGTGGDNVFAVQNLTAGRNVIDIDFAYYDVYSMLDISKPIQFLFTNNGSETASFAVSNFMFKSLVTAQGYLAPYENAMMVNALDRIVSMIPSENANVYLSSPNGKRWVLNVSNAGELSALPVVPNKSVFIGNSLLMGWVTFGMAASDDQHDYYHYVTNKIHELDGTATYSHISNGNLEHSTNETDFNTAFNSIKPYLTADLDLICIQLGDNVNTPEKAAQFEKTGGSFETMVGWIRENCPNTRLVWVGTWYNTTHDWLVSACMENNVQFIDILPLSTEANKSRLGSVIHRTEDREQTLAGTYTTSGGKINITATIYGHTYSIVIPSYTSVTDNGNGTFTMVAPYTVVDSTGVMSHPGDAGMLAIANRICYSLGLTSSENEIQ